MIVSTPPSKGTTTQPHHQDALHQHQGFHTAIQRQQWGDVPHPYYAATAVNAFDRWVVLFGGKLQEGAAVNSTYLLDLSTLEWTRLQPTGSMPQERYEHCASFLPRGDYKGSMVVFGGCDVSKKGCLPAPYVLNIDFHNPKAAEWLLLPTEGTAPPPRRGAASAIVQKDGTHYFVVVGGLVNDPQTGEVTDGSTFVLSLTQPAVWTHISSLSIHPPRAYHSLVSVDNSLLCFGGCAFAAHAGLVPHHDLQLLLLSSLDADGSRWKKVRTGGTAPAPRFQHAACLCGNSLLIAGGRDAHQLHTDLLAIPLTSAPAWVHAADSPLLARCRHAAIGCGASSLLLLGGADSPRPQWRAYNDLQIVRIEHTASVSGPFRLAHEFFDMETKQEKHLAHDRSGMLESQGSLSAVSTAHATGATTAHAVASRALHFLDQLWRVSPAVPGARKDFRRTYLVTERPLFAELVFSLCTEVLEVLKRESPLLRLSQPVVVFGDLHGNYEDLDYLGQRMWPAGVKHTPGQFLFLGDYVDRGPNSPEVVAFLLAHKLLYPKRWFLVRGNHESRHCNGGRSPDGFLGQCLDRFGADPASPRSGLALWEAINTCFDALPLAAVIGGSIFCCHGGIPRKPHDASGDGRLERIAALPKGDPQQMPAQQAALMMDIMWSDPAHNDDESRLDADGFADNVYRGAGCMFGSAAVDELQRRWGISHVLRAHQAKSVGFTLSKRARVLTIFSTSSDHGLADAHCGCVLVSDDTLRPLIGRPTSSPSLPLAPTSVSPLQQSSPPRTRP